MDSYVTKEDLFLQYGKSNFSLRTKAYFINKLINKGKISKISNDKYKVVNKAKYHLYREYNDVSNFAELFKDITFDFIFYNISFLNEWLNQLIGKNTYIIEVDKRYMSFIYDRLNEKNYNNILINPSKKEINKYSSCEIIIKPLFSRSPIDKKNHIFTIEKIIVDLFADSILQSFFSKAELKYIYIQIFDKYAIDEYSLNTYLKRRKIINQFYLFLKANKIETRIND